MEKYEVIVNIFLNICSYGSINVFVIGIINYGGIVNVELIDGEWVKVFFNGGYGYVSMIYIWFVILIFFVKVLINIFSDWFW